MQRNKTFEELSKSRGVFRTQVSIYDGALGKNLTDYYFCHKSFIIDVRLSYIYACENIEIFKVKLKWSKSSRLLLRVAFLVSLLKLSNCVTHFSVSFDFKIISWDNMILKSKIFYFKITLSHEIILKSSWVNFWFDVSTCD